MPVFLPAGTNSTLVGPVFIRPARSRVPDRTAVVIGYQGADGGFLRDLDLVLERVVEAAPQVSVGMCPVLTLTGSVANRASAFDNRPYRRGHASGGYPAAWEPGGARGADLRSDSATGDGSGDAPGDGSNERSIS